MTTQSNAIAKSEQTNKILEETRRWFGPVEQTKMLYRDSYFGKALFFALLSTPGKMQTLLKEMGFELQERGRGFFSPTPDKDWDWRTQNVTPYYGKEPSNPEEYNTAEEALLNLAFQEAQARKDKIIEPHHLLLAVARQEEEKHSQVLAVRFEGTVWSAHIRITYNILTLLIDGTTDDFDTILKRAITQQEEKEMELRSASDELARERSIILDQLERRIDELQVEKRRVSHTYVELDNIVRWRSREH